MSAGGPVKLEAFDFNQFWMRASDFINDDLAGEVTVDLVINDEVSPGWSFFSHELVEEVSFDIILRRPINEQVGTAEYARVNYPVNGENVHFMQYIVIQNDDNYRGRGSDRFGALRDA